LQAEKLREKRANHRNGMWRETTKDVRNLWPGGRKELNTVFIATINHLRLQHFTGSTAKAALEQDGKKKKETWGILDGKKEGRMCRV